MDSLMKGLMGAMPQNFGARTAPSNTLTVKSEHRCCRLQTYLINATSVCNQINDFCLFIDSNMADIVASSKPG